MICSADAAQGQDVTWQLDPVDFEALNKTAKFGSAANWTPAAVPTGRAVFGASNATDVAITGAETLGGITFNAGAPIFILGIWPGAALTLTGAGVIANSERSVFDVNEMLDGTSRGLICFSNSASASAGTGTAYYANQSLIAFKDTSTAGNASFTNADGSISFQDSSSAADARIDNVGGILNFQASSTAGNATIFNMDGAILFADSSDAGNAHLSVAGGTVTFAGNASGGSARFEIPELGTVDFSGLASDGTTAGSISGVGRYVLGAHSLEVGSNDLSTIVGGTISGDGGSLTKVGRGMLALSGNNTYTGGTTIDSGSIVLTGSLASGVTVETDGSLMGTGTIGGDVVVNGRVRPTALLMSGAKGQGNVATLKVTGNFIQTAGSTYVVRVSGPRSDLIDVGGNATLDGGTVMVIGAGVANVKYRILSSAGPLTGVLAGARSSNASLRPVLSYDGHGVFLTLVPTASSP